jgi:hypothetical protein
MTARLPDHLEKTDGRGILEATLHAAADGTDTTKARQECTQTNDTADYSHQTIVRQTDLIETSRRKLACIVRDQQSTTGPSSESPPGSVVHPLVNSKWSHEDRHTRASTTGVWTRILPIATFHPGLADAVVVQPEAAIYPTKVLAEGLMVVLSTQTHLARHRQSAHHHQPVLHRAGEDARDMSPAMGL